MERGASKHKHLTLDERQVIQEGLDKGLSFRAIAESIGRDPTTVSKEVKKHITIVQTSVKRFGPNGDLTAAPICPQLLKAPFVCNPCKKRSTRCASDKHRYYAKEAQKEYEALLSEAREGIPLNREKFYEMDKIVSEGIGRGQHLYHITQTYDLGASKSTVYRHLKRGYLSVSPLDFPRVVKFKPRFKKLGQYVPKAAKAGRAYLDFLDYTERQDITAWVEMDTLIGRNGGKVIMTLHFTFCNFMVGFLLPNRTAESVRNCIRLLKKQFSDNGVMFGDIVSLAITDNGGEFSDVASFENDLDGKKESSLFFCDPMQSSQKPRVEKNHTHFRDIVPTGQSFDNFEPNVVRLIFSHVNSIKRKSLNGKTPYEVFAYTFGKKVADIFGINSIPPEKVIQSPKLLKP